MRYTILGKGIKREPKATCSNEFEGHAGHPLADIDLISRLGECMSLSKLCAASPQPSPDSSS